jgi:hypothetical protein
MILFNNKYEIQKIYEDNEGRHIIVTLKNEEKMTIASNVYFPNDHKDGIAFAENVYLKLLETQTEFPDSMTICAGDFNVCMTPDDSMGRNEHKNEKLLADVIRNNNKVTELKDAYRSIHQKDGYTWKRGEIYSRLDYVFMSSVALQKITCAETDWAFESSDHAAVIIKIISEDTIKGPGIIKVNTEILDDDHAAKQIGEEIEAMMEQIDESWNPHTSLEFLKMSIRTVIATKVSEKRKQNFDKLQEQEEELNQLENLKIKLLKSNVTSPSERNSRIENLNRAITNMKSAIAILRANNSNKAIFTTKANWYEHGEKSNKYFLNLNKTRQQQKLISKIKNGEEEYFGQQQVTKGITKFYKNLYKESPRDLLLTEDDTFYENCPTLSDDNRKILEEEISLKDLHEALLTCKDSAPGPDGIPYSIYKKYWKICAPIIHKSWKYSLLIGQLPPSHLESVITILPKEGKNLNDIKNWRPITLSNCDSKIITKAIALKTSKVLETIIDSHQTAYVPGRSISDNLRSNFFYKNYCCKNDIDSVLISLDAKKAFDSVNHEYIKETLKAYGFGQNYIKTFETLYKDITARILINGFTSEKIKIERGVKQGDALSCALFIICIDPLLRNINKNNQIEEVKIRHRNKEIKSVSLKGAAYADDISIICRKTIKSIQAVFTEYERLTRKSGLELNADKTEILILNKKIGERINITYNNENYEINTVLEMKICGLFYCADLETEYNHNVTEKIGKMTIQLKKWTPRNLTMEGKILVIKTFGISQLIYNMQSYDFDNKELINIERIIFKFIWSTSTNQNGKDRIKRSILKNEHSKGGMMVTDIDCMNKALKLKQFVRAFKTDHVISSIQALSSSSDGKEKHVHREYSKITDDEPICKVAQEMMNLITDYNRNLYETMDLEISKTDKHLINDIVSINLEEYLKRKKLVFMQCIVKPLLQKGICTLGELTQAYEFETDRKATKTMKIILSVFPVTLIEIAKCYIEDINDDSNEVKFLKIINNVYKPIEDVSTKEIQNILKTVLKKVEEINFDQKLGTSNFEEENIIRFRNTCKNVKLRSIFHRLIHNDFFTHVKMKKYKMTETDKCPRCNEPETTKHLLWECVHSRNIWNIYNQLILDENVNSYDDVYAVNNDYSTVLIKIKIIQELIQIERPKNWTPVRVTDIICQLMSTEKHNALITKTITKFNKKWSKYLNLET